MCYCVGDVIDVCEELLRLRVIKREGFFFFLVFKYKSPLSVCKDTYGHSWY